MQGQTSAVGPCIVFYSRPLQSPLFIVCIIGRIAISFIVLTMLPSSASASLRDSTSHIGFSFEAHPGHIISMDEYQKMWQKRTRSLSLAAQMNYSALPGDSDDFARDYGYPNISIGLRYSMNDVTMHRSPNSAWGQAQEVDYDSRMGNVVSLYAAFSRPFFRTRRWWADYMLAAGVSYAHRKYNRYDNVDDELIGSRWLIYFGAGLHVGYQFLREWGVKAGIDYYHHSNGALNRPNKGANIWGPTIGLVYSPTYQHTLSTQPHAPKSPFAGSWYMDFALGIGGKTMNEDWQKTQFRTPPDSANYRTGLFHFYPAYSLQLSLMRRYARRWASGMGLDVFYGSYADHIARLDRADGLALRHSRWSLGVAARHQVYYHNWSLQMAFGWYLYRHMGANAKEVEQPYYERIGIHYTFPEAGGLTIGADVKAHRTKADLTEITIAYPIRLHKPR